MRPITARRRRGIVALATTLALIALASASALAESRSAHRRDVPRSPLRAIFYPAAKARATANTAGRPGPSTPQGGPAAIRRDLEALKWAWADAAIVPWTFPGSAADRRFGAVLSAIASTQAHVRAVALIDRPRGTEVAQLKRARTLADALTRLPAHRLCARRVRGTGRACAAQLQASTPVACGGRPALAGAGDVPRLQPLPQSGRCLVSRHPRHSQRSQPRHVPDPPGLLARRAERTDARALAGDLAAHGRAHECLGCAAPDRRFAH